MIQTVCTIVFMAMAATGIVRLAFLLFLRRPVVARVIGMNLSESERLYDQNMHQVARFDNLPTTDDIPWRHIVSRVAYDVAGRPYRTDVSLLTSKGERPNTTVIIWCDPSDPARATGIGPAWAFVLMLPAIGWATFLYL